MSEANYQACIEACQACARECERCAGHCIHDNLAMCARACIDASDICWVAAAYMSRGSDFALDFCRLCGLIADACALECVKHPEEFAQTCLTACRRASHECGRLTRVAA